MIEQLSPLPPGWTEHTAPAGHKYYYNASLKKSTYKRPTMSQTSQTPPTAPAVQEPEIQNTALVIKEKVVPLTEWSSEMKVEPEEESRERETARLMTDDMWKKLEDRPRKKTEIPGAEPWLQISTKWRRTFYYNPTTNESYWKIPSGIREIVERWQLETARADIAQSDSGSEDSEDEFPDEADPADLPVEFTEEDIAYQLSLLQSEYAGGEEMVEEEELDNSAKRQIFISLLEEKDINPFNTWETEMPKMVQDPRYSMLKNTKQRTEIFSEWARARVALIKEQKANEKKEDVFTPYVLTNLQPKVGYLRLFAEKGDVKEYWFEFRRKYRKTPEFKHYGTEKLKEDLWRDWCARKKMSREKREAELLSWMRGVKGTKEEVVDKVHADVRYWVLGDEKDDIVRDALRGR